MKDVIVVGGGIVGISVSYHLCRSGFDVEMFDRRDPGNATSAAAGILSPETITGRPETWTSFAVRAVQYIPDLVSELEGVGHPVSSWSRPGLIKVLRREEQIAGNREFDTILDRPDRFPEISEGAIREISPETARDMMPVLDNVHRAIFHKTAGRMDARPFADTLTAAARDFGLRVRRESVSSLIVKNSVVKGVRSEEKGHRADHVVIAGGAWSRKFEQQLKTTIPVTPQRGQILRLTGVHGDTGSWPIVTGTSDHYLVPWEGGTLDAGATHEDDAGFDPSVTEEGISALKEATTNLAPDLAYEAIENVRAGLRPYKPDYLPVIGAVPGMEGVFLCTGHGPAGLQLGPYSGKILADRIRGKSDVPEMFHPVQTDG